MGWKKFNWFLLILFICFTISYAQAGEEITNNTKPYSLGEVVVSATPDSEIIQTIEITGEDIEKRNADTLDKALELLPGVDVRRGTKGIPRINIRGFRSRHTLLLLNGIPMNSSYDHQFDPHIIPTENIAKIKISYGGHSVLYGQGGIGGVINIITKQGTKGLNLDVSGEMDERGNYYSKASVSGGKDNFNYFVSLSENDSEGFLLSRDFRASSQEDGGTRENSNDERLSFFANTGFQLADDLKIGLTMERSSGEFGTPPNTNDDSSDPFYEKPRYERIEDFENLSGQVSIDYEPRGIFGLRAWGFINSHKEDKARYDDDTYTVIKKKNNFTSQDKTIIKGATLQASLDFDSYGKVVTSFSGEKDEYTQDLNKVLANNDPATAFHYDYDLNLYSTAIEYNLNLFSKLGIVMGYGHHWQSREGDHDDDKESYMLGTSFKLTDTTTLRASYARKIRFPSIKQLYDSQAGVASLKPEQSNNYEAGITQKFFGDMELNLNVFQNEVKDFIEKNDSTKRYENNQKYQFKGFEARLAKQFLETGSIGISYSLLKSRDKSDSTQKDELQYRPKHKYTIELDYTWDFGLTAHADFIHIADQYHYSDTFEKGRLEDYSIVNLRLEQKLYKSNFSIYMGADNLFDEQYEEAYGLFQAGRTAYAGIRVKF